MEMEFKDNSRRRTLVLVVGVLLAIAAGAAAFILSSQNTGEDTAILPTRQVVVATDQIAARSEITSIQLALRAVPVDDTNASAFTDTDAVSGRIAAIDILPFQIITPNMLAGSGTAATGLSVLKPTETVAPNSPYFRAVSLTVPPERAVGGMVQEGQRVDLIATLPIEVSVPVNPETGEAINDPETGDPFSFVSGSSTKLMWLDVEILDRDPESSTYIFRVDLQTAEEVAHAQNQGAAFTMVLRPEEDTRDVDRSAYGETTDRLLTRYNFAVPETIDGQAYPQPVAFPTPFPNEPYLSPPPETAPSPSPDSALIEIPLESPTP